MKTTKQTSGRLKAALIFLTPIIVLIASTALFYSGFSPDGKTNNGMLLEPPIELNELNASASSGPINKNFPGRWIIVHILNGACEENCWKTLYSTRQVNIRLGKNSARVVRYLLLTQNAKLTDSDAERLSSEYPMLNLGKVSLEDLSQEAKDGLPYNSYILFDPLGNGVLMYDVRLPGGELLEDLKKLLQNSKVG
ncbi:MAG TPA: hypothetical protein EYP94_01265 [Gammaproteobacteria bacterium]|jgi:cytochrome oxidase Cu insertion factor (SCO1/SenC/PrrC family)|nr:hypothetical protein [Gammaproteobacteria bacterium]